MQANLFITCMSILPGKYMQKWEASQGTRGITSNNPHYQQHYWKFVQECQANCPLKILSWNQYDDYKVVWNASKKFDIYDQLKAWAHANADFLHTRLEAQKVIAAMHTIAVVIKASCHKFYDKEATGSMLLQAWCFCVPSLVLY